MRPKSLAGLILTATLCAQDAVPTFRTETTLVKVDAEVSTPRGASISNLQATDFVVTDEGAPQRVLDFAREGEPLRLVLLLDVSGSMRSHLAGLARASTAALAPLRPGDEVAIMLFSNGTKLVQPFTSDLSSIGRQIVSNVFQSQLGQETFINEAIVDAANYIQKAPGRHAILIVTDNQTLRGRTTDDQASRALQDANAVLDAILIGDGAPVMLNTRYGAADRRMPDVHSYTSATGGEAVSEGDIAAVFQRLVNQIRTRYFLQYAMPAGEPGAHRSIRVMLAPEAQAKYPGAIVHAREGYYVPR